MLDGLSRAFAAYDATVKEANEMRDSRIEVARAALYEAIVQQQQDAMLHDLGTHTPFNTDELLAAERTLKVAPWQEPPPLMHAVQPTPFHGSQDQVGKALWIRQNYDNGTFESLAAAERYWDQYIANPVAAT